MYQHLIRCRCVMGWRFFPHKSWKKQSLIQTDVSAESGFDIATDHNTHTHAGTQKQFGIKSEHLQAASMGIEGICSYWSGKYWPLLAHRSGMENWNSHLLIQSRLRYYICFTTRPVQTGCECARARPCYPPWRLERKKGEHNLVRTICTNKETKHAHPFRRNQ